MIYRLRSIYKEHLNRKRVRLLRKYVDIHLQLNKFPKEYTIFYSNVHKDRGKKMVLAQAETPGRQMIMYINNIDRMFDARLRRVVLHEVAHLRGDNEKQAVKAEPKEPEYED